MKKATSLFVTMMLLFYLTGCQDSQPEQALSGACKTYDGYLSVDDGKLFVNDFEFIDMADQYWINTLGLTAEDMPNGYYIHDTSDDFLTFTLSDETRYTFYDTGAAFVPEDSQDRLYTTTSLNDFLSVFDSDGDGELSNTPFEIQVLEDGQAVSVSEIFIN